MRWLLASAATLAVSAALALFYPDVMIKPGKLSDGHRGLNRDCLGCHAPLHGATAESCRACHKLPEIGRVTTAGLPLPAERTRRLRFHAGLGDMDCMQCHTLHAGMRHRKAAFFRHEMLAPEIRRDCQTCHLEDRPQDALHRQVAAGCAQCHTTAGWRPANFDHNRYFRFDANHPAACETCHTDRTTFAVYSCYGCHEHTPARILAKHQEEGIRNVENCARCHRSGDEEEAEGGGGEREEEDD